MLWNRVRSVSGADRLVAAMLGSVLVLPSPAVASVVRVQDGEAEAADPEMDEVWELIRTGDARVDAAEYQDAITAYQQALEVLSTKPEWSAQLNMLRSQLAAAHEGAFGIHGDPVHLRKAKVLLEQYVQNLESGSSEVGPARERLDEIERKLAEAQEASTDDALPADTDEDEPEPTRGPAPATVDSPRRYGPGQKLVLAGGITAAIGAAALAPTIYGVVELNRRQRLGEEKEKDPDATEAELTQLSQQRDQALTLAVVSGITAAALVAAGVTLIVVGKSKRKRANVAVAPTWRGAAIAVQF